MRQRDIPYVVKGLNRLFASPEITAVVGVFRYMAGLVEAADLRVLWQDANLLPANGDWAAALAILNQGRDFDRGERWGVYNIQRLYLEGAGVSAREWHRLPAPGGTTRPLGRLALVKRRALGARHAPPQSRRVVRDTQAPKVRRGKFVALCPRG
jgi:hypothetical protein